MTAVFGALTLAGCGAGGTGPQAINLSLIAPTDGATVNVRTILVLGHVSPGNARVLVAGRWAAVRRGTFHLRLRLPLSINHIGILASANGYRPASMMTTVRLSRSVSGRLRRSQSPPPSLPSDFPSRAEAICTAANQKMAGLAQANPQSPAAAWHQYVAIRASQNRQLIALAGKAVGLPAVRTFIRDLATKVAIDTGFFTDLIDHRRQAATQVLRRSIVLAPQWWQDAGRLGAPDCGAVWVSAGQMIAAWGS